MITHTDLLKTILTDSVVKVTHKANCCYNCYRHQRHYRLKI